MTFYKLYEGDCLTHLPKIKDEKANLVFVDPPYNLIGLDAFVGLETYRKWFNKWMPECFRILKANGTFILCGRPPVICYLLSDIASEGYVFREWITWHKVDSITATKTYHSRNYEIFAVFSKWMDRKYNHIPIDSKTDNYSKERNIGSIWDHPKISKNHKEGTKHPTQKPLKFLERFIETYTDAEDIVLDPFLGSGTTMEASQNLSRSCIGIEINPEYCDIAKNRCFGKQFLDRTVEYEFVEAVVV